METPEEPREGAAVRLGHAAEAYSLGGASWVGRGDEAQGFSILGLGVLAAGGIASAKGEITVIAGGHGMAVGAVAVTFRP